MPLSSFLRNFDLKILKPRHAMNNYRQKLKKFLFIPAIDKNLQKKFQLSISTTR